MRWPQTQDILQNSLHFKKYQGHEPQRKERNCPRWKETKEIWQKDEICDPEPELEPREEKAIRNSVQLILFYPLYK